MAEHEPIRDLDAARRADRALDALLVEAGSGEQATEAWTADCPDDVGQWHELALGVLKEEEALELEAHADQCAACAADRDLARSFAEDVAGAAHQAGPVREAVVNGPAAEGSPSTGATAWSTRRGALALAATVLIAFLGLYWMRSSPEALPTVTGPGSGDTVRSGSEITLTAPAGDLTEIPEFLSWSSSIETDFLVTVQRVDGTVVLERRTAGAELALTVEDRAALRSEVTYTWFVTAEQGDQRVRSPSKQFVIRGTEGEL